MIFFYQWWWQLLICILVLTFSSSNSFVPPLKTSKHSSFFLQERGWRFLQKMPLSCSKDQIRLDMAAILGLESTLQRITNDAKHAVVVVIGTLDSSSAKLRELSINFPSLDIYLLQPHKMTFVLLYDFPNSADTLKHDLFLLFGKLGWLRNKTDLHIIGNATLDGEWQSRLKTRILVKQRQFDFPGYIQKQPELLERPDWLGCNGRRFSASYNLFSGAVYAHHIFSEPLLDEFDYVVKIDLDITFLQPAPEAPAAVMKRNGCLFLHSQVNTRDSDCNDGAFEATLEFAEILGTAPVSLAYEWCRNAFFFYGNFVAFDMAFHTSPAQLYLSRWLYECVEDGYFKRRWGDQATPTQKLCLVRDIPNLLNSSDICSLWEWRNKVFKHAQY